MPPLILSGDIGGTKTNLAICERKGENDLTVVRQATYRSADYPGLEEIISAFLTEGRVLAAAFGIAGPVVDGRVETTNLPWTIETDRLEMAVGTPRIRLLNDLETTAYGMLYLAPDEVRTLYAGEERRGNKAIIAAGTGLGQAFLFWNGRRYVPAATEGGHVDFAPRNEFEVGLYRFLSNRFPRVSYERLLSGPGLRNIFDYLDQGLGRPVEPGIRDRMKTEDPAAVIGEAGVASASPVCTEAVDRFISIYGAQAGNMALATMAVGGVYVGGGIVTKLLPRITREAFVTPFQEKGRSKVLLERIPVRIILNDKASLIGASRVALDLLED